MSERKDNPDLAPDAVLATDLGDPVERHAKQVAEMGGDIDDIDSYDPTDEDDGSVLPEDYDPLNPAPAASQSDDEDTEEDDDGDEAEDTDSTEAEEEEADAEEADADQDSEAEAEDTDATEDSDGTVEAPAKAKGIPKHRFDEVNERRKAAEAELAVFKAKDQAKGDAEEEVYDFRANEKEYIDLTLDGDVEGALSKREEIDVAKEAKWRADTQSATITDINQDAAEAELVGLSVEAEQMFNEFNADHDDYDQGKLDKVLVYMRGYETTGMSRADAFVAGLADTIELFGLTAVGEEAEAEADDPAKKKPTGKKKVDESKKATSKKAHQPVAGEGAAGDATGAVAPNIDDMTDEELDALPEKTLARMRGDFN